ncbi:CBS domain-containing protein [Dethiobacter alkaliphilus]|uniref:CBS domain containing membrane protein n=1 Tax=Dethiobacter alkaliphilus AHT 1 TaxID=555088 RepID=C0GCR7_DETAL|nr:CBS domain-containing protein [Dethiobacter alkaliphilus]EEG79002.1 CBS domain containing membrane protein [Dethiobacter alkaliphilus AHT 1]MCW3490571.1 CBS domain-containing protein [Dethiobacter alkaliphilus]
MLAKEIMTTNVISVSQEATINDVAAILVEHRISGVPVVDKEQRVVGMVTEGDLIHQDKKLHTPAFLEILGGVIYLENPQRVAKDLEKMTATKVVEIMTRKVFTVKEDTPIEDIATMMVERQVNRVPVVDAAGKLTGIVSRQDLVKAMV